MNIKMMEEQLNWFKPSTHLAHQLPTVAMTGHPESMCGASMYSAALEYFPGLTYFP